MEDNTDLSITPEVNEIELLKKKLKDMEKELMRENCFTMLKDVLFYFELDQKKENVPWTSNENVENMMEQIKRVLKSESHRFGEYYKIKGDYTHVSGSDHGHAHSHNHGHHHSHDQNKDERLNKD
ncbi:hypothetical protein Q5O14_08605 [Eubacteriaceae bacterium ES2]|nr:hypothetical protein Q5O14_08605 [Eubacteriaceae bacterium ES2]